jgi:hypothetical protein
LRVERAAEKCTTGRSNNNLQVKQTPLTMMAASNKDGCLKQLASILIVYLVLAQRAATVRWL